MSKYGITRQPGESEEDFRRRYHREKMRIRRAAAPRSTRKRGKGKGPSKRGTLTQEEWEALQRRPEETEEDHRLRYQRELVARSRRLRPEHTKAIRLAHYAANKDSVQATAKAWREANPEKVAASQRKYIEANRAKRAAATKAWIKANPEKYAKAKKGWDSQNRAKLSAYSARWRRECRQATPTWGRLRFDPQVLRGGPAAHGRDWHRAPRRPRNSDQGPECLRAARPNKLAGDHRERELPEAQHVG